MIRALQAETLRYGHYSMAGEFVYDHPFQWGSKRTGPDLARVGGKYSDDWHRQHLGDPRGSVGAANSRATAALVALTARGVATPGLSSSLPSLKCQSATLSLPRKSVGATV